MTTAPELAPTLPTELAQEMARATAAMRRALASFAPGMRLDLDSMLGAFRGVQKVSEMRRELRSTRRSAQSGEYARCEAEYRAVLAEWDRHLPRLHGWLLAERARLGARSGHVQQVRAWIDADQQTR